MPTLQFKKNTSKKKSYQLICEKRRLATVPYYEFNPYIRKSEDQQFFCPWYFTIYFTLIWT